MNLSSILILTTLSGAAMYKDLHLNYNILTKKNNSKPSDNSRHLHCYVRN